MKTNIKKTESMEITRYGNKTMYKPRNSEDVQRVKREYEIKRAGVIEKNIRVLDKAAEEYDHNLELLLKKDTLRELDNARVVTEQMIVRLERLPHSYDGRKEKALEYQRKLLDSIIQRIENYRADKEQDSPILQQKAENEAVLLPKELDNDEAKAIFKKAVELGLMEQHGELYKWVGSNRECVYFAWRYNVEIWGKPSQIKGNRRRYKSEMIQWKPFSIFIPLSNFPAEYNKIEREECDYPKVDKIFT